MAQQPREQVGEEERSHETGGDVSSVKASIGNGRWIRRLPTVLRVAWPVLLVLGCLTVLGAIVVSIEASAHKEGLDQITATGQARAAVVEIHALSQSFKELDETARSEILDELSASLGAAGLAHQELMVASETEFSQFFEAQERLERVDSALDFTFEQMQEALSQLHAYSQGSNVGFVVSSAEAADDLTASSRQYLITLDHIDMHVARGAREKLLRLQIYESGAIAGAGLLLIILALFVIRPSHEFIDRQIYQLKSNRSMLAEAMIAAEKVALARERLLYALSHDVRGPLQTILLNVELVRAQGGALGESDEIERVARSAQRVKALVDELLTKGVKLEESRLSRVDIDEIVEELVAIYAPQAEQRGLAMKTEVEEHLPPIFASEDALKRVLENLVTNAIRYTGHGEVTIRARSKVFGDERFVAVDVVDTGPGLSAEESEEIFKEGHRLATDVEGHGLGLTIVRRLVNEELYGELLVESTVGEGSTFSVIIPLAASGRLPATGWQPEDFLERLRETRAFEDLVALVVGAPSVQDDIRRLGVRVVALEAGEFESMVDDANALVELHLIIFDADLLTGGARSLCESLGQAHFDGPVVGLYSDATGLDRDALIRAGCDALLRKPAGAVDLVEWLARALTNRFGTGAQAA